jgi:hypothetical protein
MARTQLRGGDQLLNFTVLKEDLVLDFLGAVNWDMTNGAANATLTGLADGVNPTDAATKGQLDVAISGIQGMNYKGVFDATIPDPDLDAIENKKGDFYKVSVAGTYLGIELAVGDMIILNKDVPAATTITGADLDKIDNTESADIIRISDIVDNLTTQSAVLPLSANQGYVLDQALTLLEAKVKLRTYGENLTVTHNSPNLPALANAPVAGTERVFLNGMRVERGSGNDYTISGAVITMEYNLKTNDKVLVDYER